MTLRERALAWIREQGWTLVLLAGVFVVVFGLLGWLNPLGRPAPAPAPLVRGTIVQLSSPPVPGPTRGP
ncbi:MAG TPA: hypothetical protein VF984_13785 [Actinomycetota bacterium]